MFQNFKLTLISIVISFTILLPISTCLTIHFLKNNPHKIKIENKDSQQYIISKKQDITMLLIISSKEKKTKTKTKNKPYANSLENINTKNIEKNNEIEKYIIIKISPHDDMISITDIPKNILTIAQTNEGTPLLKGTLEEIYETYGMNFLKNSIENLTHINIGKILKIDKTAIEYIINILGGIKVLSKNKEIYNIIEINKFLEILDKNPKQALQLLKYNFNEKTNLDSFFINLSNMSTTDISIHDFQCRKKGFEKMIKNKTTKIINTNIKTEKNDNIDKTSENSIKELKKIYE